MQQQQIAAAPLGGGLQFARRVIVHLDLDCFYCQVEQKRLSIPRDKPCAVQQWQGLIAVNYAARAAGITRHMRVHEAKKFCPELELVHVQTIGHIQPAANAATGNVQAAEGAATAPAAGDVEGSAQDRESSKACLQRYRRASAEIMRLLSQMCPGCLLEKASIDEAYLDITPLAVRELSAAEGGPTAAATDDTGTPAAGAASSVSSLLAAAAQASIVLGDGGLQADMEFDRLAAAGAVVAKRLRTAVYEQLEFTASAGIACNKLLAKIGSAHNKPNKQTVVLPRAVETLMQDLPLGKVKGLGGKLGARLEELGAKSAGAVAALPWDTLVQHFDTKARWVHDTVRGIDTEAVTPKDKVKSINSCKSFAPTSDMSAVEQWLGVLAQELADRMAEDETEHARRARSLVLQYRGGPGRVPDRSIRGAMPTFKQRDNPDPQVIAAAALALFKRITPAPWPLHRLALVATEFTELGGSGAGSGAAMARFLAGGHAKQQQQQNRQLLGESPSPQQGEEEQQQQQAEQQVGRTPEAVSQSSRKAKHQPQQQMGLQQFLLKPDQQAEHPLETSKLHHVEQQQLGALHEERSPAPQDGTCLEPLSSQQGHQVAAYGLEQLQPQQAVEVQQQQQQQQGEALQVPHHQVNPDQEQEQTPAAAAADSGADTLLHGVNVAEQARLLREIEIQQLRQRISQPLQHSGSSSSRKRKQGAVGGSTRSKGAKADKQQNIADMFGRVSR